MTPRRIVLGVALLLFGLGLWQLGGAAYIHAKAWLAHDWIAMAWARTLAGERAAKPWPWADTWPVARLTVPRLSVDTFVLAGGSGRTLAFGPGHVDGSPLPGEAGTSLIAGHRDTHFRFLADLLPGDDLLVEDRAGTTRRYRVTATDVVDARSVLIDAIGWGRRLVLTTCYPFEALTTGGPLRYVVFAEHVDGENEGRDRGQPIAALR